MPTETSKTEHFSLVEGGPIYKLNLLCGLVRKPFEIKRLVFVSMIITWVPLFILSLFSGLAVHGNVPFLYDIEIHVRCLVALPIFLATERVVYRVLPVTVEQLLKNEVVGKQDLPRFHQAIHSVVRWSCSTAVELILLGLVLGFSFFALRQDLGLANSTWYRLAETSGNRITPAGYWLAFVSFPVIQFVQLRWYLRLGFWFWFLWRVSRLNLQLTPAHPDRTGGIGFVSQNSYAFAPIVFAQGATIAGLIANRVIYVGRDPLDYQAEVVGTIMVFLLLILGPLTMFTPKLISAKWRGLQQYTLLANRYIRDFDRKWNNPEAPPTEGLLGSSDIQSLADMGNSYSTLRAMRVVPFGLREIAILVILLVLPMLPLALLVVPLATIERLLLKALF